MSRLIDRRRFLGAVGAVSLAGCVGNAPSAEPTPDATGVSPSESEPTTAQPSDTGELGPPTASESLPLPMAPRAIQDAAVSGGPPKDGIPAIDEPSFVSATSADGALDPDDIVFGLAGETDVKAYPQAILVWHEICNDVVDGTPVSVTYCPLTGTAMGFERGETTFGVSGRLVNNNLIMYDRATEAWWPQVLATAVPGPWREETSVRSLREFRLVWTTWSRWRTAYPDTAVLSRETGYARNYDRDPYGTYNPRGGYYEPDSRPLFGTLGDDDRLPPKQVVLGTRTSAGAAAFVKERLRAAGTLQGRLADEPLLAVYDSGLDTGYVYRNPAERSFEFRDGVVVDSDGGSHDPRDLPLDRVLGFDAMWFAWSGFYPDTTLHA